MRLLATVLAVLFAFASAAAEPIPFTAHAVALDDDDPGRTAVGDLVFRGGLDLRSADNRFSSFSSLAISPDGGRMTVATDYGYRIEARLSYDARGNLAGAGEALLYPLGDTDGSHMTEKKKADAESLAVDGDHLLVAFERLHRIWSYAGPEALPVPLAPLPGVAKAPRNGGVEALTVLADGRILAITEKFTIAGGTVGWVGDGKHWDGLFYVPGPGFRPTGAATLPDGDVLVLERMFAPLTGRAARLVRVDRSAIAADALLVGRPLAKLRPPLTIDNFEGVDVRLDGQGRTFVYLVSDDNNNMLQRTLLMMFELTSDK